MFIKKLLQSFGVTSLIVQQRSVSVLNSLNSSPVLVSRNKDVYTNLALEQWLYNNLKFGNSHQNEIVDGNKVFKGPVVLIWTDEPSVVIGRHQNPWIESTLGFVNKAGIKLARRHSGGGCVYHDENNINISIISERKLFENRQNNLKFIAQVLDENYGVKCEPTKRHDLIHSGTGLKMSGSAAKLGRFNCYHHFTLLVDTDKETMQNAIRQKQQDFIHTSSSLSTRSKVINLKELKPNLDVNRVIADLAVAYSKLYKDIRPRQPQCKTSVEGDRADFMGLNAHKEELESWKWIYGTTPKFKLERCINLIDNQVEKQVKLRVFVNRGLFEKIEIDGDLSTGNPADNFDCLIGTNFTYKDAMINIAKMLQINETNLFKSRISIGSEQIFATFLLQMVHEANF